MDWNKLKTEYVTTDTSYRKLAAKYGVTPTQISNVARKENWVEAKKQFLDDTYTKTLDAISKDQAQRVAKLYSITDKVLSKLEKFVDVMDENDLSAYRQITAAVKDIKDIQMIKSKQDIIEQQARIDKIKKDVNTSDQPTEIVVRIEGEKDGWSE